MSHVFGRKGREYFVSIMIIVIMNGRNYNRFCSWLGKLSERFCKRVYIILSIELSSIAYVLIVNSNTPNF